MTDNTQLSQLYETCGPAVFGCVYAMLKDYAAAEDIMQTVFMRLYNYNDIENPIRNHKAWLITVARNLACNHIRDCRKEYCSDLEFTSDPPAFQEQEEQIVFSLDIRRALAVLGELEHQLFLLHYLDRYKYRELAAMYSLPIGSVKTYCHCAKNKLIKRLKTMEQEDST